MPPPRSRPSTRSNGGFRYLVRQVLYLRERNSFGCDREDCDCRKHLTLPGLDGPVDMQLFPWLRHILRLEGMIAVGCKFAPDDLGWDQWRDLQVMAIERQWIQGLVRAHQDEIRKDNQEVQAGMQAARQAAGVPGPGQSLFGGKPAGATVAGAKTPRKRR